MVCNRDREQGLAWGRGCVYEGTCWARIRTVETILAVTWVYSECGGGLPGVSPSRRPTAATHVRR